MTTQTTLFCLVMTLLCYEIAEACFRWSGRRAVFNPLLWSVVLIVPCLKATDIRYADYFKGTRLIHFLLGPATLALAVPLYEQRERVRASLVPLACGTAAGAVASIGLTVGLLSWAGVESTFIVSCAPKSVTTPVAMAISERLGGIPPLTASAVLMTGIAGAITAPGVLAIASRVHRRYSKASHGFALGMCAHGAGAARAFQDGNESGAFAGLAIGLHALMTSVLVPVILRLAGL